MKTFEEVEAILEELTRSYTKKEAIRLDIPMRVKPKARPRIAEKKGKRWWYTPTTSFEEELGLYASKIMRENGWEPLAGRIRLSCTIYLKGRRRADLSNFLKAIEDGLEGVCYYNDIQIEEYGKVKVIDKAGEDRVIVELEDLGKIK